MPLQVFHIMHRALHISFYVLLVLVLHGCNLYGKIDGDSVEVKQGRYDGETVELTFSAELTGEVSPGWKVYWDRNDGRFHSEPPTSDGITLSYEVFNPFGELDLKTLSVTFYVFGRKRDTYRAKFLLKHPD